MTNVNKTESHPAASPDVLIVDDDPTVAAVLKEFLQEEGFAVCTEPNGARAIRRIERVQPTVVLADMMMPHMDGLTLADEIHRRWACIDVVLMSASETPMLLNVPFIQKPFDLEFVANVISNCPHIAYGNSVNRI